MSKLLLWAIGLIGLHCRASWGKEDSHGGRGRENDGTISFAFKNPANTTVCGKTTFEWSTSIDMGSMSLLVASRGHSSRLVATIPMSVHSFSWDLVTVPEGWYILQASVPAPTATTAVFNSSAFFVDDGSDSSCITDSTSLVEIIAPVVGAAAGVAFAFIIVSTAYFHPRWWHRSLPSRRTSVLRASLKWTSARI
ncbi:uncharacterized protein EV420DRAFT_356118 [Desarmillaria tabescens]|uniref:Uncharacterized protein n=1 Tax=Armillaria tabescens TaxID=1929756 RepID=A0AA39KC55_ARMTA|nr:uncharacterized protein EV420DRAFT_356118 [Desarmillaria tabescens]KAK0458452.1 hypothetical protein EV420DRAFT_356118 [Desarmillaria tabescens]